MLGTRCAQRNGTEFHFNVNQLPLSKCELNHHSRNPRFLYEAQKKKPERVPWLQIRSLSRVYSSILTLQCWSIVRLPKSSAIGSQSSHPEGQHPCANLTTDCQITGWICQGACRQWQCSKFKTAHSFDIYEVLDKKMSVEGDEDMNMYTICTQAFDRITRHIHSKIEVKDWPPETLLLDKTVEVIARYVKKTQQKLFSNCSNNHMVMWSRSATYKSNFKNLIFQNWTCKKRGVEFVYN